MVSNRRRLSSGDRLHKLTQETLEDSTTRNSGRWEPIQRKKPTRIQRAAKPATTELWRSAPQFEIGTTRRRHGVDSGRRVPCFGLNRHGGAKHGRGGYPGTTGNSENTRIGLQNPGTRPSGKRKLGAGAPPDLTCREKLEMKREKRPPAQRASLRDSATRGFSR